MGEVAKQRRTVFFVSHNMTNILQLGSRAILLNSGRISMDGVHSVVVEGYIESSIGQAAEVIWEIRDASGNSTAMIRAVRVLNAEGKVDSNHNFYDIIL